MPLRKASRDGGAGGLQPRGLPSTVFFGVGLAWRWLREGHGPLDATGRDAVPRTAQGGDAGSLEGMGRGRRPLHGTGRDAKGRGIGDQLVGWMEGLWREVSHGSHLCPFSCWKGPDWRQDTNSSAGRIPNPPFPERVSSFQE